MSEINEKKIILSQEKFDEYKKQYDHLINIERPAVQEALKEARAQGDLSENVSMMQQEKQGIVEGRIKELEAILDNAAILDSSIHKTDETIGINTRVEFLIQENNKIEVVQITGSRMQILLKERFQWEATSNCYDGKGWRWWSWSRSSKKFMIKILKVEHL
ncbi:transcription elongation factor GreA [Mycoplasmopsis cynos]|nr:transcription elongation factor GreA [Mycoplasmopsis cynos]